MPRLTLAALAAALGFAATPVQADKIKMGFTGSPTTLSLPFFVAQTKGWLGDLEVEEVYVTGDSNAMRVLLSKNVDIATIGAVNVLTALEAGANIKAIGSWQPLADYNLVIKAGKGSTLADLAGKTIATSGPGGMPDQLPRMVMRKHKVDENSARFLQVGGHAARLQAVIGGRAEATVINIVTSVLGAKDVTVAGKMSDEFPKLGYVWNVVREESLADPRLSKAFETLTMAGIKGSRFIMENPEEAAQILHERVPDLSLEISKVAVAELNRDKLWGVDGGLDPETVKFTSELNRELGIIKTSIEPSRLIDSRFVDAALKSVGQAR